MHIRAGPAEEEQIGDMLDAEVRDDEIDRREIARHRLQHRRGDVRVVGDAARRAEHAEVDQRRDAEPLADFPDRIERAVVDR